MAWFDKFLYELGQASPIGRAIEGGKQDSRMADQAIAYNNAPDLAQFAKIQTPDNIYSPENRMALAKLKAERLDALRQADAGPKLAQFARDYTSATGTGDFTDAASMAVLRDQGVNMPTTDMLNPYIRKGIDEIGQKGQLTADLADSYAGSATPLALARIAVNPLAQSQHNIISTQQVAQDKAEQRTDKQSALDLAAQGKIDLSNFQGAIGGLIGKSTSPVDFAQFAKNGGYAPFPQVESDIRQAAQDYNVGDSPEIAKAITDARGAYEKTMLPSETVKVGQTTATGQRNLLGDFRKDVQNTAPVTKINMPGAGRVYPAIDTKNGNRLVYVDSGTITAANIAEPGRYAPASQGAKALGQTALQEDIKGSVQATRQAINGLKTDFTPAQRAQFNLVLKDRDPKSAYSNFMGSAWGGTLTPDQQDYIVQVLQLKEQAMGLRSLLGAGQGSDAQRNAIFATIPGAGTTSKQMAHKQLDAFETAVNRIGRGTPSIPLRTESGTPPATPATRPKTANDYMRKFK